MTEFVRGHSGPQGIWACNYTPPLSEQVRSFDRALLLEDFTGKRAW